MLRQLKRILAIALALSFGISGLCCCSPNTPDAPTEDPKPNPDTPDKPSRFEFINKHREHTLQKEREYAEYKLEKYKKKASKKKK